MPPISQSQNAYAQGVANGSIKAGANKRKWAQEMVSKAASVPMPKMVGDANDSKYAALSRSKVRKIAGVKMPRIANYGVKS